MKNIAIIYHDADFDGILSNAVCRYWMQSIHPKANVHSYGWDYGRPVPDENARTHRITVEGGLANTTYDWTDYDAIYIVDLSVDELMARPELRDKIVWIDHHKTAMDKWVNQGDKKYGFQFTGYRIDGVAACRLCWQWFYTQHLNAQDGGEGRFTLPLKEHYIDRKVDEPKLIRLAGEYDIWDKRDPNAEVLQYGLRALSKTDLDACVHYALACDGAPDGLSVADVLKLGKGARCYADTVAEANMKAGYVLEFEGLRFLALNGRGNSLTFKSREEEIQPDALLMWYCSGSKIKVSLYHANGQTHRDLSGIAKKYGGGGHRGACGFELPLGSLNLITLPL